MDLGSTQTVQVLISFGLSKPSHAYIEYGSGATGDYEKKVTTDTDLSVSKFMVIPGLIPGNSYHFRIVATDRSGNVLETPDYLVLAPSQQPDLFSLILDQIKVNFSFLGNIGGGSSQ